MKPVLLIDVGNTRLKWATVTPRGAIRPQGSVATADATPRWLASWAKKQAGKRVVVASVVPRISAALRRHFKDTLFVTGTLPGLPLAFHYPRPAEIGADRLAAAIGAQGRGAAIIVSCGTATAFSVLDKRGRFCGGAIALGPQALLHALLRATAQLPNITLHSTSRALARSTKEAIRAGLLLGWQGGVREIVTRLRQELGTPARIIITGGSAPFLKGMRGLGHVELRPLLVFEGLRIIADALPEP
jgi:type III pantothenate kinase